MVWKTNGLLLALAAGLLLFAVFAARLGFFIVDEAIYVFAADTFAATGGFTLQNGFDLSTSGDLFLSNLLSAGPDGITSQYPPGTAIIWAPLVERWGLRGIIVFNAACMVGAVYATYVLALRMLSDAQLALLAALLFLFGTFALEYAFVLWPHSVSILTVLVAWILFLQAQESDRRAFALAFASGLTLGAGVLFRMDNMMALPAFGMVAILYAARFAPLALGGAVGLAVPMALLSLANHLKFGTLNPLSYGVKDGGHTNLSAYASLAAGLVVLCGVMWMIRTGRIKLSPVSIGLAVLTAAAVAFAVPEVQRFGLKYLVGFERLVIDARQIPSPFSGVTDMPDGTRSFWGLSKKALGQSLPWLGVLLVLLAPKARLGQNRMIVSAVIFCLLFSLPFILRNWHGGMSSNMRYFLPILPVVAILAVSALKQVIGDDTLAVRKFLLAIFVGLASSFLWMLLMPSELAGAHQIFALYVFAAVAAASLVYAAVPVPVLARLTSLVVGFGIGVSVFNTTTDTLVSQLRRAQNEVLTDLTQGYDGKALIYGALMRSAMASPDQIVAAPQIAARFPDPALLRVAFADGYRVLMPQTFAEHLVEAHPEYRWQVADGPVALVEVFVRSAPQS